jgi:hypothetical protein
MAIVAAAAELRGTAMSFQHGLNIITLIVSTITLFTVTVALLPQLKQGMAVARDIVLWAALILVVSAVTMVGWNRYGEFRRGRDLAPREHHRAGDDYSERRHVRYTP